MLQSLFTKLLAFSFIKKRLKHKYFLLKFAKFFRTPILRNICKRLLLNLIISRFEMCLYFVCNEERQAVIRRVLKNFAKITEEYLCQSLFLIRLQAEACNIIKKETLVQVFSWEFGKTFKNTIFLKNTFRWLLLEKDHGEKLEAATGGILSKKCS